MGFGGFRCWCWFAIELSFAVGLGVLLCIDFWRLGWVAGVVDLVLGWFWWF